MKRLPHGMLNGTKYHLISKHFGINYNEYLSKVRKLESGYDKTIVELF